MLRSAGARRLRKTLRRCPAGAKIARRNAFWSKFAGCWRISSTSTFLCASVTTVYLFFFVIGRVLTRLDWTRLDVCGSTRTRTQSRRLVRREGASWSLNWPSGANLLARKQHMYFSGASVTTVCLFFFVIGRVLTRLDNEGDCGRKRGFSARK